MNQNTSEAVGRIGFKDVASASSGGRTRTEKRILHKRGSTICPISQLRGELNKEFCTYSEQEGKNQVI